MSKILTLFIITLITFTAFPVAGAESVNIDREMIDSLIEEEMKISRIPGLSLGIVYNGEPVYVQGYGRAAEDRLVNGQTPFIIGSISKSFTALAAVQLVESGKLELDHSVRDYLPWFTMGGAYDAGEITVRHLLVQTSGIPNEAGVSTLARSSIYSTEEEVRALSAVPLADQPGNSYTYSNANFNILGLLIEQFSENGYRAHVQDNIFAPLGMTNSYLSLADGLNAGLADGHTKVIGFPVAGEVQYLDSALAAGFIISTAEDMCNYLLMHLNGGNYRGNAILSEAGLAELYKPGNVQKGSSDYAMGLVAVKEQGELLIMHDGMTEGFNSGMVFSPSGQWGVIVLTNVGTMIELPAMPLALAVADLIRGAEPDSGSNISRNFYLAALFVLFALIILVIRSLVLLPKRWAVKVRNKRPQGLLAVSLQVIVPVVLEGIVPLFAFIIIPGGAGFPIWRLLSLYHPDLVWGVMIISGLMLIKVIARLVIMLRISTRAA